MPRVYAFEMEAAALAVETEQAETRHQFVRAAGAVNMRSRRSWRTDEVDLRHHHPARMLLAKQDHPRDEKVHIGRAERAGPAHFAAWVLTGADQVDIGLSIDLPAAQKKRIHSALRREIERLHSAVGIAVVPARAEQSDFECALRKLPHEQRRAAGDRRSCAHDHVPTSLQQASDDRDQKFGPGECVRHVRAWTGSCRSQDSSHAAKPTSLRAAATYCASAASSNGYSFPNRRGQAPDGASAIASTYRAGITPGARIGSSIKLESTMRSAVTSVRCAACAMVSSSRQRPMKTLPRRSASGAWTSAKSGRSAGSTTIESPR